MERSSRKRITSKIPTEAEATKVVVTGDVAVDWFLAPKSSADSRNANWQLFLNRNMLCLPGGSLLLAGLVQGAFRKRLGDKSPEIIRQHLSSLECKLTREFPFCVSDVTRMSNAECPTASVG